MVTLLSDKERLTPIGSFVRKTSLDELPQLFNIALGQMSFVGPPAIVTRVSSIVLPSNNVAATTSCQAFQDGRRSTVATVLHGATSSRTTPGTWIIKAFG